MKNNYLKTLLAGTMLLACGAAKAQTYMAGDILAVNTYNASHDSTTCSSTCMNMLMLTISNSFMGDSVKIVDLSTSMLLYAEANTAGSLTWNVMYPLPIFNSVVTDDQVTGGMVLFAGPNVKVISGTDTIALIPNNYMLTVTNPCQYGSVTGHVYVDNNGDCTYNSGDVDLMSIAVTANSALSSPAMSSTSKTTYSGTGGMYGMNVQESWMTSYNVTLPSYYYFIFPATPCFAGAYTFTALPQTNVDFPLQCTNNVDVECWAGSPGFARPATPFYMQPYVNNTGCDSASGVLTLIKDSRVSYNASMSTNPAVTVSGDTLTWNYVNLNNMSGAGYWNSFMSDIHLTPDATVMIGDTLHFRVYTGVPAMDINSSNNSYAIDIPVVASYDPNIKDVAPKGTGAPGYIPATTPELAYTIHFQNTGTAAAYNVSVVDTLDSDVDATSLKITGNSHAMTPEWLAPGVVKFNFNYINLPDSLSNEPASHGFVRFTVKPHAGLPVGTQIKNKGYIYFDTNPAVITNTALNTIGSGVSVPTVARIEPIKIYPNPAADVVTIENLNGGRISIINVSGQVVLTQDINSNKTTTDISKLADGIYILKAVNNNTITTTRFTKQ